MKRKLEFSFYLEMWAYIVKHKLQKICKYTKDGIKLYILEWDDGNPEPEVKVRRVRARKVAQ